MKPLCHICWFNFDLDHHRPKVLPCGHTFCKECVEKITLKKKGRKCPTCRKDPAAHPADHPDNILAIQMMEEDSLALDNGPPAKVPRLDETRVQQLEGIVDTAKKLVQQLQQMVPVAVEALNRQLESSVAELRQLEETLDKLQRGEAAGDEKTTPDLAMKQLQLQESLRMLTTNKIAVVAEEGETARKASVQPGQHSNILHLLLLQLLAEGHLDKVDTTAPAAPVSNSAFVGAPLISILTIDDDDDVHDGQLQVNKIIRDACRWKNDVRSLKRLKGRDSEKLLRVVGPHLEELEIIEKVEARVLEEVAKMPSLKRLYIICGVEEEDEVLDEYPDLPLNLEELVMHQPSLKQLRCVQHMPRLRSLEVHNFIVSSDVSFTPPQHGGLLWLTVCFNDAHMGTMLSLIRAHNATLQVLKIVCDVSEASADGGFYFPDLGQSLAACGLRALRRLILNRDSRKPCVDAADCLLQRRTVAGFLPSSIEVTCEGCYISVNI